MAKNVRRVGDGARRVVPSVLSAVARASPTRTRTEKSPKKVGAVTARVEAEMAQLKPKLVPVKYEWKATEGDEWAVQKSKFLAELSKTASIPTAARKAGVSRSRAYRWRGDDPDFAAAWQDIWQDAVDRLEHSMIDRALHGSLRPVYQNGALVGLIREFVPAQAMFLLSKLRPDVYGDKAANDRLEPTEYAKRVADAFRDQDAEARAALEKKKE